MNGNNNESEVDHPTRRLDNTGQDISQEQETQRFPNPPQAYYVGDASKVPPGPMQRICPDCGGELIWAMAMAGSAPLRTVALSGAGFLNQYVSDVAALICDNCGLTRFYTLRPDKVRER